jgi:hypothetical protein
LPEYFIRLRGACSLAPASIYCAARLPPKRLEKSLETLILQGFYALSPVAKKGFSGYNMSYFNPVLWRPGKVPSAISFQVSKQGVRDPPAREFSRGFAPHLQTLAARET